MPTTGPAPRIAMVTGSASGIGAAVTQRLRHNGYRVAGCDIDPRIADTSDGFVLDVRDSAAVEQTVNDIENRLGPIEALANVAGLLRPNRLLDTTPSDWADMFSVNTTGAFNVISAVARRMIPRRRGAVVTVTSITGSVPRPGIGGYAASKAAAGQLTRCFGLELAEHGIRCNVVAPGSTDTPMLHALADGDRDTAVATALAGNPAAHQIPIPLGKVGTATDVAEAVAFLLSDAAGHITLQELFVDGGTALK